MGPNSLMVVYVDPLGSYDENDQRKSCKLGNPYF